MACIHSGLLVPLPDIRRWRGKAHNLCKPTKIKYKNKKYRQIHMNCSAQCEKWRILWLQTANAKMGERMQQRLATDCGQKRYHDGPYLWPNRTLSITYGMYAVHTRTASAHKRTHGIPTHTQRERNGYTHHCDSGIWIVAHSQQCQCATAKGRTRFLRVCLSCVVLASSEQAGTMMADNRAKNPSLHDPIQIAVIWNLLLS